MASLNGGGIWGRGLGIRSIDGVEYENFLSAGRVNFSFGIRC